MAPSQPNKKKSEMEPKTGRQKTATTGNNIEIIRQLLRERDLYHVGEYYLDTFKVLQNRILPVQLYYCIDILA